MSFARSNRPVRSQVVGKTRRKGKPVFKREWDNTIRDLSVHRAGPEELARRRETHVSRNRAAAQCELRQRAAASGGPRRRAARARAQPRQALSELMIDRRQLHDALTRSDCALAVVRDLFGDAPRLRAACPNVTMAPGGDVDPGAQLIAQRSERPTQLSLLSESVMDSQALNETACSKELEADCSVSVQREADGPPSEPKTPEPRRDRPQTSPTWTPDGASVVQPGLNATSAIQRVKSRVESRAENDTDSTSQNETIRVIRQVLYPGCSTSPKDIARDKVCDVSTKRMGKSRPEDRQIKLQQMIEKIDKELEEYERQTGYEVSSSMREKGHGLTGFTFSLVSLISRLTRSLKECRNQQWQEKENYQQLLQKSNHQQALIDALTAEFLSAQNKMVSLQVSLQQYVTKTDDELYSLKQMLHGMTQAESRKPRQNIAHIAEEIAVGQESLYSCAYPKKQGAVFSRVVPNVEECLLQNQKQPCTYQNKENQNLPEHSVGPAVLLSPPRQRNSQVATGSQTTVNLCHKSPLSSNICKECKDVSQNLKENTVVPQGENYFAKHLVAAQNPVTDCQDHTQQQNICDYVSEHKNLCVTSPVINFPCMYPGAVDDTTCNLKKMENNVEAEGGQNSLNNWLKHEAMLTQITELQLQNSALKAHLEQFQVDKLSHPAPQIEKIIPSTSDSLQQRIAELNHQSAEARSKLLQLIEQQRQISSESVSPTISPIPSEVMATRTATRTLEVLIPHPSGLDSSTGSTPSPANKINKNRSVDTMASSSLNLYKADGNRIAVAQGSKPERLKEEGWFALSTHTL
ncbi:spindle and centriole-associated protein 1 [Narcine bancroftii]|uniref:spindle and centriole-associated protein 1 n=1 Tax=Narcine bancroftii TaxID=1343680 RepID=UPI00383181F6